MRRMVVELYGKALEERMRRTAFQEIESMEVVHFLKLDQNENAAIWKIRLKDPDGRVEDCLRKDTTTKEVHVLGREDGEGAPTFMVFVRRRARPGFLLGFSVRQGGGFLYGPVRMKGGKVRLTFIGTQKQVRMILDGAEERGIQYKLVSLTDADFAEDSLLNRLTERQRKILVMAYKLGYYDVPKKINSDELASHFHLTGSTVVEHLGKAEHRLLASILGE